MSQEINFQSLGKKRILVAEDVELNQYLARHIMESWGFEVEIAMNGREALRKVLLCEYDLILMDIQMPEMDGMEATQHIRALDNKRISQIPIVALTANALKGDSEKYMAAGMNDYLSKPFDETSLFQVIYKNLYSERAQTAQPDIFSASADGESASACNGPAELNLAEGENLYSLAMVEAISGGDQDFVKKMLQLFLDTIPEALNDIEAATCNQRWEVLSKLAHKLKSTIDSMGITRLKQLVRVIESNGKTGTDTAQLPALVKTLVATLNLCMHQIKKDHSL